MEGDLAAFGRRGYWLNIKVEDPASSSVFGFGLRPDDLKFTLEEPSSKTRKQVRGVVRREAGTFSFAGEGSADEAFPLRP